MQVCSDITVNAVHGMVLDDDTAAATKPLFQAPHDGLYEFQMNLQVRDSSQPLSMRLLHRPHGSDVNTLMKQTMPATHACMPSLLLNMPLYMRAQDTVWLAVEDQHGQPIDYHTFSARLTTLCTQH